MDMTAFEKGSGLSVSWVHLTSVSVTGVLLLLSVLMILVSIVMKLNDKGQKFHYGIIVKIAGIIFIVALILGVIGSM